MRLMVAVLAALAGQAVRRDEPRRHELHRVAQRLKQPGPVMSARTCLHADGARRQRGDHLVQLGARHARADQFGLASRVNPVHRKHVLGEIDADEYDSHGLPLPNELMRARTSHRGTLLPVAATRLSRDGEVPFIR